MKIAIPVEDKSLESPVCASFGRTPYYLVYDLESGQSAFYDNDAAREQGGAGIKAAQALCDLGAGAVVAVRCGENAAQVLRAAHIACYKAQDGSAGDNVAAFKDGKLAALTDIHPGFHRHG